MDGEDQPAALTNVWNGHPAGPCPRWMVTRSMPLVEWALTPMGHCNPEEEYANFIASTNYLEILCFVTGPPLARLPKPTKSCSDFLYEAERSMYTLRALTKQGLLAACRGEKRGKSYGRSVGRDIPSEWLPRKLWWWMRNAVYPFIMDYAAAL